ncbi:APC family permease [Hyphococcus luteus]|uniref:Amino acid permease n=1 Tax=Hyphococcus luteus TaxID=2058213 RepID=A0A2S7K0E7_9PROT|nr:APC family permease [Marinicaulis flavus]PQA85993.1 amino acid permease [Marinicaulis flavus]
METHNAGLKKGVSLLDIVSIGLGTAVGVSIFSVVAPTAALAGPGMMIAMAASTGPMIVVAIVYAFLGSAAPVSGASYEWSRRFIHPFVGFFISWLRIAGSTAAMVVLTMVLVSYLAMVFPVPLKPAMFVIFTIVFIANLLGVSVAAKGQSAMLIVLLLTCAVFVVICAPDVDFDNYTPVLSKGWPGVIAALPLMITLFLGIESATEVGGEIRNPGRNIPLGILICVVLTAIVYFAVAATALGVLGEERLAASSAPLLDAAVAAAGGIGKPLIIASAFVAIGSSINATFMVFTRFLYAMGRTGVLPRAFGSVHKRFHTPHVGCFVAYAMCCAGLLLPSNLVFLFLAVNIPTLLKYGATSLAAIFMLKKEPALYEQASFRPGRKLIVALAIIGIISAFGIIWMGLSADWRPYTVIAGWAVLGVVYYVVRKRKRETKPA